MRTPIATDVVELSDRVLDLAFALHSEIGPGCLEKVYETCLEQMLLDEGIPVVRQVAIPLVFRDRILPVAFRADLLVDDRLVIEVKAVPALMPVHQAQLATYVKLMEKQLGLLLCFGSPHLRMGYDRIAHPRRYFPPPARRTAGPAGDAGPREPSAERQSPDMEA